MSHAKALTRPLRVLLPVSLFLIACSGGGGGEDGGESVAGTPPEDPEVAEPDVEEEVVPDAPPTFAVGESLLSRIRRSTDWLLRDARMPDAVFLDYHADTASPVVRSTGWSSALRTDAVAWDAREAGVLITPRHVLMAEHFRRGIGDTLVFHDSLGFSHRRTITGLDPVESSEAYLDLFVALLDSDVPIAPYPILPPRASYPSLITGAPALVTTARRTVGVASIDSIELGQTDRGPGEVVFGTDPSYPRALVEELVVGDSGHPTFVVVGEQTILLSIHSVAGPASGGFLSTLNNSGAINAALQRLGGGYALTIAEISVP